MILDPILPLLVDHLLEPVHPLVIRLPLRPHEGALLVDLLLQVVPQGVQTREEVRLEGVQGAVHKGHLLHSVLTVRGDVTR